MSDARKTSNVPTRIYTYGATALSPEHQVIVNDQIWHAHRYYNRLVEIERDRRNKYRQIRRSLSTTLDNLERQYDEYEASYLNARARLSGIEKKDRDSSPVVLEIRELKSKRNELYTRIREEIKKVEREHFR